jgi:hypothetical protein
MGCAESCNTKDVEAKVNEFYVNASNYFVRNEKLPVMQKISFNVTDSGDEATFSTRLNDIPPSDRMRIQMQSERISRDAVCLLSHRGRKQSLFVLNEDHLVKNVKRQLGH